LLRVLGGSGDNVGNAFGRELDQKDDQDIAGPGKRRPYSSTLSGTSEPKPAKQPRTGRNCRRQAERPP
jgi:hypothetical protein